jgi:hypothetical protein
MLASIAVCRSRPQPPKRSSKVSADSENRTDTSGISELRHADLAVYRLAMNRRPVDESELRGRAALLPGAGPDSVDRLIQFGLLQHVTGQSGILEVNSPHSEAPRLLDSALKDVELRRAALERVRTELVELAKIYRPVVTPQLGSGALELLTNLSDVLNCITEFAATALHEIRTSQPGGARKDEILAESMDRTERALRRGVRLRTIYQHTARFSTATVRYVEQVSDLGAEIRTVGDGFMQMLAFDNDVAMIGVQGEPEAALVVREPNLLAFVIAAFERAWTAAQPFPRDYRQDQVVAISDEMKLDIVRMLIEGKEDRAIARRMGISLRTCQRHVSEVMDRLGARSRLQAGYLLRDRRLFESGPDQPDSSAR